MPECRAGDPRPDSPAKAGQPRKLPTTPDDDVRRAKVLSVATTHVPEMQAFARNFRRARRQLQLSQREVAEQTGVAQSHVSEIEHGLIDPRVGTLVRLARLVGVPLAELFR